MSAYTVILKRGFTQVVSDDEEVVPGNIGALQFGLQALLAEDAQDFARAEQLWNDAKKLLLEEAADETAGSTPQVIYEDIFGMSEVGGCGYFGGGYYGR